MFNLEIFMQNQNEITTNVIKQTIKAGFVTPNRKTWSMSQLQKEGWKQLLKLQRPPLHVISYTHITRTIYFCSLVQEYSRHSYSDQFS